MEEAQYLSKLASEVVIIHRRDEFRASKIMVDRVKKNPKIKFELNSVVKDVIGKEENGRKMISGAILENTVDGSTKEIKADGLFIAIGHKPNTDLFKDILDMDETGYLIVQPGTSKTNIEGIYAAGDVCDKKFRQAVTAYGCN